MEERKNVGKQYYYNSEKVLLEKFLDFKKGIVRNVHTQELEIVELCQLMTSNEENSEEPVFLDSISDKDWEIAQQRFSIIESIVRADQEGTTIPNRTEWIKGIAKENNISMVTIYRWLNDYNVTGMVSSLAPLDKPGGRGKSRLDETLELIINDTIRDVYMTSQKKSQTKVVEEVLLRCRNAGINPPHENTIRNRIARYSQKQKLEKRAGKVLTDRKAGPAAGHFSLAKHPLDVVQIDHTLLDIIVVSDRDREPIGRPWITVGIDVFSRMITGLYISMDPPGSLGTGICLSNSILPKDHLLAKYNLKGDWPVYGVMGSIHMDNAKEFRGNMLKRSCKEYGISINWRPVTKPHWGAYIERLLGTFGEEVHALPGTTFSDPKYRQNYDSEAKAIMTLAELEEWLYTYIVDKYHQRIHEGIGTAPILRYAEGIFGSAQFEGIGLQTLSLDEEKVKLDFLPYFERTIRRTGVTIDHITYYHDVFKRYLYDSVSFRGDSFVKTKTPTKFVFKRDPRDISKIYFFDPTEKKYVPVFLEDRSRPGISIWEHREALRYIRKTNPKAEINQDLIFDAIERMKEIETRAQKNKREARRENRARKVEEFTPAAATEQTYSSRPEIDLSAIKPFDIDENI